MGNNHRVGSLSTIAFRKRAVFSESATGGTMVLFTLGVFAHLVVATVFKTVGGFERSSLWVRFPYTPVSVFAIKL
jgi:hypothetical protein